MYRLTSQRSSLFDGVDNQSHKILKEASLYSLPFFTDLPESKVQIAIARAVTFEYPAKRPIILEEDCANSVYFILQGWLKVCSTDIYGQEVTLNIVGRGELFGEMAALDVCRRSTDVITMTPVTLVSIPSTDFIQFLKAEPEAGIRLARLMGNRLRRVNRFLRLRQLQASLRIVDILLFLAEVQEHASVKEVVIPKLPHQELGNLCGLARETVTRELAKLKNKNLIQCLQNSLYIPDLGALETLSQINPFKGKLTKLL
jgi:CRP/FNR family transcriptional regulator, cyclic AMP receptor protein